MFDWIGTYTYTFLHIGSFMVFSLFTYSNFIFSPILSPPTSSHVMDIYCYIPQTESFIKCTVLYFSLESQEDSMKYYRNVFIVADYKIIYNDIHGDFWFHVKNMIIGKGWVIKLIPGNKAKGSKQKLSTRGLSLRAAGCIYTAVHLFL